MTDLNPGDDVYVWIDGGEFPGVVLKVEKSGYILCTIHTDPLHDWGRSSPRVMPEQVVAVRCGKIRLRETPHEILDD